LGQRRDIGVIWHCETCAEIVPEGESKLCAGLEEAQEGVAAIAAGIASCAAADFAPGDLATNIVFRSVGVERDFGPLARMIWPEFA
jgi:hypothetical protein